MVFSYRAESKNVVFGSGWAFSFRNIASLVAPKFSRNFRFVIRRLDRRIQKNNFPIFAKNVTIFPANFREFVFREMRFAPVAQRIRAGGFYPSCRGFDSLLGYQRFLLFIIAM